MPKQVDLGYHPRPLQREIHAALKRFSVLVLHRRSGKTVLAAMEAIDRALRIPSASIAYVAPLLRQAREVAWPYLQQYTRPIPGVRIRETDLSIRFPNRSILRAYGADNPDSLRGAGFDLVIVDEVAQMASNLWPEVLRPALADKAGSAIFIGTPRGKDLFHELFQEARDRPDWYRRLAPASETGIIPQPELAAAAETMDSNAYAQEFECSFTAGIRGAFYASDLAKARKESRITTVVPEAMPTVVAFDLGLDDATACWFAQVVGREIHLIDYREWHDTSLEDVLHDLAAMPYRYAMFSLPHDVAHRELTSGRPRLDLVERMFPQVDAHVCRLSRIEDGVAVVRLLFPKFWFDADRTALGVDRLERYRRKFDPRTSTYLRQPLHDDASHGADAMRYLAIALDERSGHVELSEDDLGLSVSSYTNTYRPPRAVGQVSGRAGQSVVH